MYSFLPCPKLIVNTKIGIDRPSTYQFRLRVQVRDDHRRHPGFSELAEELLESCAGHPGWDVLQEREDVDQEAPRNHRFSKCLQCVVVMLDECLYLLEVLETIGGAQYEDTEEPADITLGLTCR